MESSEAKSVCVICGHTVLITISKQQSNIDPIVDQNLKMHLLTHINHLIPGYKDRKCTECNIEFDKEGDVERHALSHSNNFDLLEKLFLKNNGVDMFFSALTSKTGYIHPKYSAKSQCGSIHEKLDSCPVCKSCFRSVDNFVVKLHLIRHFVI